MYLFERCIFDDVGYTVYNMYEVGNMTTTTYARYELAVLSYAGCYYNLADGFSRSQSRDLRYMIIIFRRAV